MAYSLRHKFKKNSTTWGQTTAILLGVIAVIIIFATGLFTNAPPVFNGVKYIPVSITPEPSHGTLQLQALQFISVAISPTPSISLIPSLTVTATPPNNQQLPGLHVQGNKIVDTQGTTVRLHGANRSGAEFSCVSGRNIFDGPSDTASLQIMKSWKINAVRVPLNEDCWLGINGVGVGGAPYQQAIISFINNIIQTGMYPIIDLHWNAPGSTKATGQQQMTDRDHSIAFWNSVALAFKGNNSVIFDAYNEPHDISWSCWKNGGTGCGPSWAVAGMQELVNAIRSAGATNIIMLGGLAWSNDLSQWLANKPSDPQNNLAASWHVYNFNGCNTTGCFDNQINPVAAQVPVIAGEMGEDDCAHGFIDTVMNWMDAHNQHYLGWTWNTWSCTSGPALISNYNGTPTNFGIGLKNHLQIFP